MKVAIAQIAPALGDVARNAKMHGEWIGKARRKGADLILFPELSLTGYLLQDLVQDLALEVESSPIRRLARQSKDIAILAGFAERSERNVYYNSAALFEGGRLTHLHRKVYLPTYGMFDEGRYFGCGDRFRVHASARLGRVGVLVCEDAWHLSASYLLAQGGADLICVPSAGPVRGMRRGADLASRSAWRDLCKVSAQFHTVYVLLANRVGHEDGWTYSGGSLAVDPRGKVIAEAGPDQEELLLVDVKQARLREARGHVPLLRDERPHLVARELDRLLWSDSEITGKKK
jgi:predicted amidohydrolase